LKSEVAAPIRLILKKCVVEWDRVATYYLYRKATTQVKNDQDVSNYLNTFILKKASQKRDASTLIIGQSV
jgi:hypothetical protein